MENDLPPHITKSLPLKLLIHQNWLEYTPIVVKELLDMPAIQYNTSGCITPFADKFQYFSLSSLIKVVD